MGSVPWTKRTIYRLLDSRKYADFEAFTVSRGGRSWTGTIECGSSGGYPCIFVAQGEGEDDVTVTLDARTLIDGVPAKEWRE